MENAIGCRGFDTLSSLSTEVREKKNTWFGVIEAHPSMETPVQSIPAEIHALKKDNCLMLLLAEEEAMVLADNEIQLAVL